MRMRVPAAYLDLHRATRRRYSKNTRLPRGAAVTYRLNEGKHSRESVISIIAPRKRNRTRKIFIFCTTSKRRVQSWKRAPRETVVSTGSLLIYSRRIRYQSIASFASTSDFVGRNNTYPDLRNTRKHKNMKGKNKNVVLARHKIDVRCARSRIKSNLVKDNPILRDSRDTHW